MSRIKQTVNTSWAGRHANEASNQRFLQEIELYDLDIQKEIQDSEYRTARNLYDIEQTKADIKFLEEDPEGYFYEKEQAELEKNPKTFGNYMKNWWASLGRKINDLQIGELLGYIDRANLWKSLADSVQEYLDIQSELLNIESQLNLFRLNTQNQNAPIEVLRNAYGAIDTLEAQKESLLNRMKELLPDVDAFKSYVPGSIKGGFLDVVAGNGENGIFSNNALFGRTGLLHDELGDITRHTTSMFSPDRKLAEQKDMLKRAMREYDDKIQEWQRGVDANIADRESYNKVDRWFLNREQKSTMNISDSDTWLYGMPGLLAGSVSGMSKILPAMLTGALTGAAVAATGGAAALGIAALGGSATYGLNYGAGVSENNSEVAMAYNERLEDYLKNKKGEKGSLYDDIIDEGRKKLHLLDNKRITDELIFELYRKGAFTINNAKANKEMQKLAIGIENQFQDDMMATTYTSGIETLLEIIPIGKALSIPRALKYKALRTAAGREAIRNGDANAFMKAAESLSTMTKGFEVGGLASPVLGALYAPAHILVSPAMRKVGRAAREAVRDIERTSNIAERIPERALLKKFRYEPTRRYLKDISGRWIASSISESIEEGKQNISANRYLNGEYSSAKIKSIGETILDDFLAGSKSAGLLMGMPFEDLMSETDRKTLQEMKGGLILGGLQTAIVNTAQSVVPYVKEQKANVVLTNAMLMDKARKIDKLNKAKIYVNASNSSTSYLNMLNAFDRLRELNRNQNDSTGEYGVAPKYINDEIKEFKKVASMAHDPYTLKLAKTQGIQEGTDDFERFVAVKNLALDELNEAKDLVEASSDNLNEVQKKIISEALIDKLANYHEFLDKEQLAKEGEESIEYESEREGTLEHQQVVDYARTTNIAYYSALLRRREQLNLGITNAEARGLTKTKSILKRQLANVNNEISKLAEVIDKYAEGIDDIDVNNIESVASKLVTNKEMHDELTEAFRQTMVAGDDFDLALDQYQRVVGKSLLNGKEITSDQKVDWSKEIDNVTFTGGEAKKVIKEIQDTIDDDNNLASAIDEDFEDRTDDNGEEVINEERAEVVENTVEENNPEEEYNRDKNSKHEVETPENVSTATDEQLKETNNKISEKLADPAVPESTKQTLQAKKEEIKEEKRKRAEEKILKTPQSKNNKTPVRDIIDKLFEIISNADKRVTSRIKESFRNVDKEDFIKELESIEGGSATQIRELLDSIFSKHGLRSYWSNRDAYEDLGISGNDVSNTVYEYLKSKKKSAEPEPQPTIPPKPPVPPQDIATAEVPSEIPESQINTLNSLRKLAEDSNKHVKKVTSEYYVIEVNGEEIQMPRVHSVMEKYWTGNNDYKAPLQLGNVFDNLARIFFSNKSYIKLYERDRDDLIDRLFDEHSSHKDSPWDPSLAGYNLRKYSNLYTSKEAFADTIDALYNVAKLYERLGWELSTEPITWFGQFKSGWVAGETDMIAVDRDSNIHIIDFKTAVKYPKGITDPFAYYELPFEYKIPEDLQNRMNRLTKDDFTAGERKRGLSKAARELIKDIRKRMLPVDENNQPNRNLRKQTIAKRIKLDWSTTENKPVLRYIQSDYTDRNRLFRVQHDYKDPETGETIRKGSKEDEYSDQLTAYATLIKQKLFNVVDMEILGFRASYNTDVTNLTSINSIKDPIRIKVFESPEMKGKLQLLEGLNVEGEAPEVISEEPDPVQLAEENREQEEQAKKLNLQLLTKNKPTLTSSAVTAPENTPYVVVLETSKETPILETVRPGGNSEYSNLNAVQLDREYPDLAQDMIFDADFINDAIRNGEVELYTEVIEDRKGKVRSVYANITHNGKTYKRIYVYDNQKLYDKIVALEEHKKPGQKIIATAMSRTDGEIRHGETKSLYSANLLDIPVNDLVFDASQGYFGIVEGGYIKSYANGNPRQKGPIYNLKAGNHPNGSLVYLKHLKRNEGEKNDSVVPILLQRKSLGGDANFIMDCLKSIDTIDLPHRITVKGQTVSIGATKRQLLDLLIPYIDDISQSGPVYSIIRDPNVPTKFYVVQNKNVLAQVDTRDGASINAFKGFLSTIRIQERPEISVSRLASSETHPAFKALNNFIRNNKSGITSLNISDSLVFDANDFKGNGITGIAWYTKSGILVTDYDGLQKPLISINDVGYDGAGLEIRLSVKSAETPTTPKNGGLKLGDIFRANWGGLKGSQSKRKTKADENKPLLTEDVIKKNLRPILGDLVDDPAIITIVKNLGSDPRLASAKIVGKASADGITIYNEAFEGVEYHEAFHRIFELFVPRIERENVYAKAAKIVGIDLSNSTKENNYEGHRQVAEWLADKYMDHRQYNVSTGFYWLDRIINFISDIVRAIAHLNSWQIYKLFLDINSGKYRNMRTASKENVDRFNEMFKELNYEIHSTQFDHIANDPMYDALKQSAFYCLLIGLNVDVSGATILNTLITRKALMRGIDSLKKQGLDLIGSEVDPRDKTAAQLAMSELVVKFDAVADDLAAMMASISTDYRKIMQEEAREDADGGESQSSYDENFFKWSYEFDKFDKTTSRVKFFFATIPDIQYEDDTKTTFKYATNELGMPLFIPMNYVFNNVLSNLWDVDTIEEALARLADLAIQDAMYLVIYDNLKQVVDHVTNEDGTTNANNEALLAQLMTTIRSNRHTFMLLRTVGNPQGRYDIILLRSDADYNAREFTIKWSQILSKGGSETLKLNKYGQLVFNPRNPGAVYTFKQVARLFDQLYAATSQVNAGKGEVIIPSYVFNEYAGYPGTTTLENVYMEGEPLTVDDITDPKKCDIVKTAIVDALQRIGINIHRQEFDWMLMLKYGSSDWIALQAMMQSTEEADSMTSFRYFLLNITSGNKLNLNDSGEFINLDGKKINFNDIYSSMAFVKELGNWKYEFRHMRDQLSILATGNNRFYEISDNDYMSDVLRNANKRGKWFEDLKKDPYNYFVGEPDNLGDVRTYGSISLKLLSENPELKLQLKHFIGFKTDKKGDEGQDYFEISRREDYLSKVSILENDGMVSLTLSDKKKYCYITGVKLPGIDYTQMRKLKDGFVDAELAKLSISVPDGVASNQYTIQQLDEVVELMLSYAISEYQSILANAAKLKDGHRKVANFDTKEQSVKFSSLLGVWETAYDKEGKPDGELYISFNDNNKSWEENLGIAEAYFFDRTEEEQKALLGRILSKLTEKELKTAESLGLIAITGINNNPFLNYTNLGLNNTVIQAIKRSLLAAGKNYTDAEAESRAVVMYVNDISNKTIMSGQEMERLYSGNPAFYKWKYNDKGILIDRTVDELKRLGGLGSTGVNNFTQLTNIPQRYKEGKYRVAEVDNEMVSSPQYQQMKNTMYEGALRQEVIDSVMAERKAAELARHAEVLRDIYKNVPFEDRDIHLAEESTLHSEIIQDIEKEVVKEADDKSVEQLEKDYPEITEKARTSADDVSDALAGDIDVADGGAYISDQMCETLLRMEGAYSDKIAEAFKILRGETEADYLSQIKAYLKVLTSVIGNLKYTAFGRRLLNGVSVPYYHKMALFPIFDCIATGRMRNVYDKMKEQEIDMLLINSAVKVGSEGSKPINWSDYRVDEDKFNPDNYVGGKFNQSKPYFKDAFQFNTYDIEFDYLRKQLNTDPKEEEMLRMGTQMQKIVFSSLMKGRVYTRQDGSTVEGDALLKEIMHASNELSNLGVDKINRRFFSTNEDGELLDIDGNVIEDEYRNGKLIPARNSMRRVLDIEKFAKEVNKMMSDRGADSNILKALELVTRDNDKQLRVPLGAISNANWLESVLISELNKEIIDVNTPGAFFIQRSIWAMEGNKLYDGKKNVKGDTESRSLYNGKSLKMVNEEGSMDCVLSIDFFKNILPQVWSGEYETDSEGNYIYQRGPNDSYTVDKYGNPQPKKKMRDMTFNEAREWLIKKGIIGDKAKSNIVAYRIPTQAQSSIHALRCVDVIPVVRDTVILPQEFTKITGSDFDIDKLGLSTLNFKKNGSSEFKEGTVQYYQNQLIKDYITMLIDPKSQHILHRSIDKDTKLLKDVLKEIEKSSEVEEMPYGFYSLSTLTERKDDYITGKIGIGPFALNNNSHILTMLYGVKFKELEGSLMTKLGLTDLSSNRDQDGNSIMSWLSALINAHVDIAKDPYISRLNVNPFTYNLVNTLIRTGFGKNTFYFTTLPIMKELAKAYNQAGSSYMADQYKSKYTLQKEAVKKVATDHFADEKIGMWTYSDMLEGLSSPDNNGYKLEINNYIKQLVDNEDLRKSANSEYGVYGATVKDSKGNDIELTGNQVQMLMYFAYVQMDPYALSVSNLVKYSKIDTKKHGKSYIEQQIFENGYDDLFENPNGTGLFEASGLKAMAEQSYIDLKTRNALAMTKSILKGQFLLATDAFDNALHQILGMIGKPKSKNSDLWDTISKGIMASIKSEFINQYAKGISEGISTYIRDLVSESEEDLEYTQGSDSNRLKIVGKPKYSLKSYIEGKADVEFAHGDKTLRFQYNIIGYDEETNELIVDQTRKVDNVGKIHISGGKNTMYDRFVLLTVELKDDPKYKDVFDLSGEFANALLKSLVTGNTFKYVPMEEAVYITKKEVHDTYETLKFIKLFNALDQNGVLSNHIIDGWDQLLHDEQHPKLAKFARDLVVYAFVTSGDQGGFTKFFKQVPLSWRIESGYADFILRKLDEFRTTEIPTEQLEDVILNNWFDGQMVPKHQLKDENGTPNFIAYYGEGSTGVQRISTPSILAALKYENGIYTPYLSVDEAPLFIKVPRRDGKEAKDSQRRVTVYKRVSYGMRLNPTGEWVHYPIYVKVEPKGNQLRDNYLMTEYGREDATEKEYTPSEEGLRAMYKIGDFIALSTLDNLKNRFTYKFADIIEDMNYADLLIDKYGGDLRKFNLAYAKDRLHTTFNVEVDPKTLIVSVPSKYTNNLKTLEDVIFSLIYNEPSHDSAVQLLEQSGYDVNEQSAQKALGKLIKKLCKDI